MLNSSDRDRTHLPPPAPPLPPQHTSRYGQRAATAIARFAQPFFSGSRAETGRDGRGPGLSQGHNQAGLLSSHHSFLTSKKEAIHKTGLPISAIDISPYKTHAILAGKDILKTIRIDDATCTEDINLRSRIRAYASTHDRNRDAITASYKDQLTAVDVKWSHGSYDSTIATAAANGRIVIYDLNRPSVEIARLHEHTRQVHRIAFNPHQGAFLLSASQDGTTRLWDLRALGGGDGGGRSIRTCSSWKRYSASTEGIRDVQWSPNDGYTFAVGTESGLVQKWTLTKENSPLLRIHAHDHSCSAVTWHPEGRYLASGGSTENLVKIWDFGLDDRRMLPINTIRTPQAVMHVKWRPSTLANDNHNLSNTANQITTSYDTKDPRIHVWDLQRPSIPILEVDKYETPVTGMVWYSKDLLWTVGHTGTFTQNDMKLATDPKTRHGSAMAIGSDGRIAFFSSRKPKHNFFPESVMSHLHHDDSTVGQLQDRNHNIKDISPDDQMSDTSIHRRRQRNDDPSINHSFGSTTSGEDERSLKFEELRPLLSSSFTSTQLVAIIKLPPVCNVDKFTYLVENYRLPSQKLLAGHGTAVHDSIQTSFEENALFAEFVGDIRLAQTWRILGHAVRDELCRRLTLSRDNPSSSKKSQSFVVREGSATKAVEEQSDSMNVLSIAPRATASSLSTPLAQPKQDLSIPGISAQDNFSLSAASSGSEQLQTSSSKTSAFPLEAFGSPRLTDPKGAALMSMLAASSYKVKDTKEVHKTDLFPGYPVLEDDLEERRNALGSYRARPRAVLNLDTPYGMNESSIVAPLERYDSNESFQMFSASADSDQQSFPMDESFDDKKSSTHSFGASFRGPALPDYLRTRLDQLKEDDGRSTPKIIEPHEADNDNHLRTSEKTNIQPINNPASTQPVQRPLVLQRPVIHKADFAVLEPSEPISQPSLPSAFLNASEKSDSTPWNIYSLLKPLLKYHIEILGDPQLPTILALWLWQFFPSEFERGQITALALFYYRRLHTLQLFEPLAQLRKCYKLVFPEVLEYTTGSDPVSLFCQICKTAWNYNNDASTCPRCKTQTAICSICESNTPPSSDPVHITLKLWSWCQGCGHGGHGICLSIWFSQPDVSQGTCAVLGCNHDCVDGPRREQVVAEIELLRRRSRKPVVKDEWTVGESRAVGKARDIVGAGLGLSSDRTGKRGNRNGGGNTIARGDTSGGGGARRVRLTLEKDGNPVTTSDKS